MSNTLYQQGVVIQIIADADVTSGTPHRIGRLFGVPESTVKSGQAVGFRVQGVHKLPKQAGAGVTFALGDLVYWDESAGYCVTSKTAACIGVCTVAAANGDSVVTVVINGMVDDAAWMASGTVAIAGGASAGTASVGSQFNSKPVVVTLQTAAGAIAAAVPQVKAAVSGGTLTVTLIKEDGSAVNASANIVFAYMIDGR